MAATTVDGSEFTGQNATLHPIRSPGGPTAIPVEETIPTTSLDEADDRFRLVPLPLGATIVEIKVDSDDLDSDGSPALDMDIVIDENGTETVLFNAGTHFQAAAKDWVLPNHKITDADDEGKAYLQTKVNTGAATAQEGDIRLLVTLSR